MGKRGRKYKEVTGRKRPTQLLWPPHPWPQPNRRRKEGETRERKRREDG
jgi:hypothetical protein